MNTHDADVMLFTLLTEAQNLLNRALSHHFRQTGSVHGKMFETHKQVAELANEYRKKILVDEDKPAEKSAPPETPHKMLCDIMEILLPEIDGDVILAEKIAHNALGNVEKYRRMEEFDDVHLWRVIADDCLVNITDTLTADECYWKIREYLEGRILKERVEKGRGPLA